MGKKTASATHILDIAGALSIVIGLYLALLWAPTEVAMGPVQRIFYFHVPAAWVGFFAFFVTLIASVLYLWRRARVWDIVAASSVEIGVAFSLMAICSGSIWARVTWNTWWTWDPRLTTTTVMLAIYAAYLMLRGALDDPARRARFVAVYGIVGFISVPITFMAIRWWRTIHPIILSSAGFELSSRMLTTLLVCIGAFTLFYFALLVHRVRLECLADEVARLREQLAVPSQMMLEITHKSFCQVIGWPDDGR